jgi:hypothetical protein
MKRLDKGFLMNHRTYSVFSSARHKGNRGTGSFFGHVLSCILCLGLLFSSLHDAFGTESRGPARDDANSQRRYQWLFGGDSPQKQAAPETASVLNEFDKEIKQARKLYLSGDADKGTVKYRSAIDRLESALDAAPAGDPLLTEIEKRFGVFEEVASKVLGPMQGQPREDASGRVFHLFEKRRLCRRNIILKKALPAGGSPIRGSSKRGPLQTLDQFRKETLRPGELVLDFNIMKNRMAVGIITREKALYHQSAVNSAEINEGVLSLQDKLKEYSPAGQTSFLGHAWKEPSRRLHRALIDVLPRMPEEFGKVFIIPDEGLWYLPFSVLLDGEDQPFGLTRLVSMIPSGEALTGLRRPGGAESAADRAAAPRAGLVLYESLPWASEDQIKELGKQPKSSKKGGRERASEGERIERLILTSEVYPKPSEITPKIQRLFKKVEIKAGPRATIDKFTEHGSLSADVVLAALPLAMVDIITENRRPTLFFSPDKQGKRRLDLASLFSMSIDATMVVFPTAWPDAADKSAVSGEGPLLMMTALFHAGVPFGMINFAKPDWGDDDACLLGILERISKGEKPGEAWAGFPRSLPANIDSAFVGTPPSWAGWILFGDPGASKTPPPVK